MERFRGEIESILATCNMVHSLSQFTCRATNGKFRIERHGVSRPVRSAAKRARESKRSPAGRGGGGEQGRDSSRSLGPDVKEAVCRSDAAVMSTNIYLIGCSAGRAPLSLRGSDLGGARTKVSLPPSPASTLSDHGSTSSKGRMERGIERIEATPYYVRSLLPSGFTAQTCEHIILRMLILMHQVHNV